MFETPVSSHERRGTRGHPRSVAEWGGGGLSVALLGLILAIGATLLLPWPTSSADDPPLTTALHYNRLAEQAASGSVPGLVLDVALYGALVVGVAAYVVARFRGGYAPLGLLVSVGLFGLAYTGKMVVPFVGPLVGLFGFALVVSGAGVAWAANESPENQPIEPETLDTGRAAGAANAAAAEAETEAQQDAGKRDTGINDDVSYSPA